MARFAIEGCIVYVCRQSSTRPQEAVAGTRRRRRRCGSASSTIAEVSAGLTLLLPVLAFAVDAVILLERVHRPGQADRGKAREGKLKRTTACPFAWNLDIAFKENTALNQ